VETLEEKYTWGGADPQEYHKCMKCYLPKFFGSNYCYKHHWQHQKYLDGKK